MAEEELLTSSEANPTNPVDSHKRKLEDLEPDSAPEPTADTEPNSNLGSVDDATEGEENVDANESEAKRPRLESNGDNADDTNGQESSQNGYQEEVKADEPEEEQKQPEPEDNESPTVNVEEPAKETSETTPEEFPPNENDKPDAEKAEEPVKPKEEAEEPLDKLPREGDIPIPSSELHSGSGAQILSRKMEVPNDKVGVLIGKAGDTIRSLQDNSGAKIQIMRDADADPRSATRPLELVGTLESINKAEKLIKDVIAEADAGGSPSLVARGFSTVQAASGGEQLEIRVPIEKVGLIIGKGGETIRNLQTKSGARIQLMPGNVSDGDQSGERTVRISGNKRQIDTAREMIKDVMNQTVRPSPLSGGYSQPAYRPRGPAGPQWGPRGPHHAQFSGYDYPQRGPYPSQGSQYLPTYGNYPPQHAPRSNFGPSWEQRPPTSMHGPQGSYYGQQQGPDYGHPPPYSQPPAQPYGHGYGEVKYDHHGPPAQHYSQSTPYGQGSGHPGYGPPQDQYAKPPMYGMQPQVSHTQTYGQPRPSQPSEVPYQVGPIPSAQNYGQNVPPQQSYPYASSAPMQQSYPPYGSAPNADGYVHPPATASTPGYHQNGQPAAGYGQPGGQPPPVYPQPGATGSYSSYPTTQPAYSEQPAVSNAAYGGYQAPAADPAAYGGAQGPAATYPAAAAYAQPSQTQPTYDQSGGYGNVPAPTSYGKSVSPQPTAYPQYDASQMYGAHR